MMNRSLFVMCLTVTTIAAGCGAGSDLPEASPESLTAAVIVLDVGQSVTREVSTHCGYERLELEINDSFWATETLGSDSAGNPTEPAWPQGTQSAELRLELVAQDTLSVTAPDSGVLHEYHPIETEPWCE